MARGLAKVMMIGNLGADPEMRYTAEGTAVTNFRIAVPRPVGRDKPPVTDWFSVTAWQKLGEICNQYLHKGAKVYVEGRLQEDTYTAQDGQKRYRTVVVASDMVMLDTRQHSGSEGAIDTPEDASRLVAAGQGRPLGDGSEDDDMTKLVDMPF